MPSDYDSYYYYDGADTVAYFAPPTETIIYPPVNYVDIAATGGGSTITHAEGADTTKYVFTATRHGDLSAAGSATYAVTGSTTPPGTSAADAADFTGGVLPTGTISFAPGEFTKTVTIEVAGDTLPEPDEAFAITLVNADNITLGNTLTAYGVITNDDSAGDGSGSSGSGAFWTSYPDFGVPIDTGDRTTGASYITIDQAAAGILYDGHNGYPQTMKYLVERTGHLGAEAVVTWQLTGTGATPVDGADFFGGALPSGTLTFAPGYGAQLISVTFTGDTSTKPDGGYLISLATTTPDVAIGAPAPLPDQGDESSLAGLLVHRSRYVAITATDADKQEGDSGTTPFVFTVTRSALNPEPAASETVTWKVGAGYGPQLDPAVDFAPGFAQSGTITFAAGELSQTLTIAVAGDTIAEPDEQFVVQLTGASPGEGIAQPAAYGTIRNDDINFAITADTPSQHEGNSGATPFVFTITRTGGTGTDSVGWTTIGATAHSAGQSDLVGGVAPSGRVTFAPGQTTQSVTVMVAGDTQVEPDEAFQVVLLGGSAGTNITTGAAQAVILNDDAITGFAIYGTPTQSEGDSGATPFVFFVARTNGSETGTDSVGWAVIGAASQSASPRDFVGGVAPSGRVTFAPGQTVQAVTVNVAGDTQVESNEAFRVVLGGASVGTHITANDAQGMIVNDDTGLSITADQPTQHEGNSGATAFTFTVSRTGLLAAGDSVRWGTIGLGPHSANPADFVGGAAPTGSITFAQGEASRSITLEIQGDTTVEPDEGFRVVLAGASHGATITTGSASAEILNDDLTPLAADSSLAPGMTFLASADFNGDGEMDQLLQGPTGALDILTVDGATEIAHLTQGQSFAGLTDSGAILLHDTTVGAADPWTVLSTAGVSQPYVSWPPG